MKITTILGSPRKKGNTNRVLQWVEEVFLTHCTEVNRIDASTRKIGGCKGCYTCKKFTDRPGCPQKDDAVDILHGLMSSNGIIYASPIYFWGFSAQMKAFVDRHCALVTGYGTPQWQSLLQGKSLGLVVTCEDGIDNNVDLTEEFFKRFVDYLQCEHAGTLVVPFTTKPEALGEEVRQQARTFAEKVIRIIQEG